MGHIKEPKGVDFIIQSELLSNEERAAIDEFICSEKAKKKAKHTNSKKTTQTKTRRVTV